MPTRTIDFHRFSNRFLGRELVGYFGGWLAGLAGLAGQAGPRPGNQILEVLLGWPKMVPEPLIFIDFE